MNTTHLKVLLLLFLLNFALSSSSIEVSKSQFQRKNNGNPTSHKPSLESSEDTRLQRPTRVKRDLAAMLKGLDDRLYKIEYQMTKSNSTIEHLRGFLSAIGFLLQSGDSRNANPCRQSNSRMRPADNVDTEGTTQENIQDEQTSPPNGEDDWILVGSSTCVKIINGLYNYDEAKELCRNEMQIGQDITYPEVVRLDSIGKKSSIVDLLRTHEPLVAGVWVDIISNRESTFGESHSSGSQQGCTELRNGGQNTRVAPGHVPWLNVECIRTNSVMCEKTLPIPYAEIVRKYSDRVEVEKKSDLYAYNERVELNTKIDEINDWKQTREEQITVDAEQIKLMADQTTNLAIKNALLQTQLEGLKQRNVELELSANLSREINENMGNLFRNLSDTITLKSANTDLNVETSFRNLSASFAEQLLQSESKLTGQLGTLNETLTHSLSHLASLIPPPPTLTEVQEVNAEQGTINFTGGTNSHLRRKIWVLKSVAGDSCRRINFVMETMKLGDNARLSLWGSYYGSQHEWKGSPAVWQKAQVLGSVILVTLTISPGAAETPSFKLKFNTTGTDTGYSQTSEVLRKEGPQVVSFPSNNAVHIPPLSEFTAVVAPLSGRTFGTTLKYLDFKCNNGYLKVWFLDETGTGDHYKIFPSSAVRRCGSPGAISEPLGNSTVTILKSTSHFSSSGRGYRVEFD